MSSETLLKVDNLSKRYPIYGGFFFRKIAEVHATENVSFEVKKGETLGLVGESGCGKSTLAKVLISLYKPSSGSIEFNGQKIEELSRSERKQYSRKMQMVFQDPFDSLNEAHTLGEILTEPFKIHKIGTASWRKKEVKRLLAEVGLSESYIDRYPHEFSGGQRQRIGLARAIALKPEIIICDEPVSALDVSIQSQILNLLLDLQKKLDLTYVFIAHDLAVVRHVSDRIAVMYLGKIVELADSADLFTKALHPYTKALIEAIPIPDPSRRRVAPKLRGELPSPRNPPSGCHFHTRCPLAQAKCSKEEPLLRSVGTKSEHLVACHLV